MMRARSMALARSAHPVAQPFAAGLLGAVGTAVDRLAGLDAMTTSRLIEQDNNLSDSWKAFGERNDMQESETPNDRRPGNGVLGLLVEYSKAHAGGKGPSMG